MLDGSGTNRARLSTPQPPELSGIGDTWVSLNLSNSDPPLSEKYLFLACDWLAAKGIEKSLVPTLESPSRSSTLIVKFSSSTKRI
jgi:hypothetical protein